MPREYCQRKFGKTQIEICRDGHISIIGDWYSNYGCIYGHNIKKFKNNVINPCTGLVVQIIGMDSNVAKYHLDYIYSKIKKGYFDHLI